MADQKIRIRLKAYDHRLIDRSASEIVETATMLRADEAIRLAQAVPNAFSQAHAQLGPARA